MMINVITSVDGREALEKIGRRLLEKKLVACLQIIGPVRSVYWWKGRLEEAEEWIGVMKTRRELYGEVEEEIRALHPYETAADRGNRGGLRAARLRGLAH